MPPLPEEDPLERVALIAGAIASELAAARRQAGGPAAGAASTSRWLRAARSRASGLPVRTAASGWRRAGRRGR